MRERDASDALAVVRMGGDDARHPRPVAVGVLAGLDAVHERGTRQQPPGEVGMGRVDAGVEDRDDRAPGRGGPIPNDIPADPGQRPLVWVSRVALGAFGGSGAVPLDVGDGRVGLEGGGTVGGIGSGEVDDREPQLGDLADERGAGRSQSVRALRVARRDTEPDEVGGGGGGIRVRCRVGRGRRRRGRVSGRGNRRRGGTRERRRRTGRERRASSPGTAPRWAMRSARPSGPAWAGVGSGSGVEAGEAAGAGEGGGEGDGAGDTAGAVVPATWSSARTGATAIELPSAMATRAQGGE